jgi:hypothetical protein
LKFLHENTNSQNYYFILGYVCHILSDIFNNIAVWTPFRLKYPDEFKKGYGGLYRQESKKVDIELALREDNKDNFWIHLEKATPITLDGIIFAEEIKKHKENILHSLYRDKGHQDVSSNKLIIIESTMNFVDKATGFILEQVQHK